MSTLINYLKRTWNEPDVRRVTSDAFSLTRPENLSARIVDSLPSEVRASGADLETWFGLFSSVPAPNGARNAQFSAASAVLGLAMKGVTRYATAPVRFLVGDSGQAGHVEQAIRPLITRLGNTVAFITGSDRSGAVLACTLSLAAGTVINGLALYTELAQHGGFWTCAGVGAGLARLTNPIMTAAGRKTLETFAYRVVLPSLVEPVLDTLTVVHPDGLAFAHLKRELNLDVTPTFTSTHPDHYEIAIGAPVGEVLGVPTACGLRISVVVGAGRPVFAHVVAGVPAGVHQWATWFGLAQTQISAMRVEATFDVVHGVLRMRVSDGYTFPRQNDSRGDEPAPPQE